MAAVASLLLMLLAPSALAQTFNDVAWQALGDVWHALTPNYMHFVNNRAGESAFLADLRGAAFIRQCQALYRQNASASAALALQSDAVCSRPRFSCSSASTYIRTHDGTCNNRQAPGCGRANSALLRMLPASYADGIYKPRRSKSGKPLPSARECQTKVYREKRIDSKRLTLFFMQFSQFVSHDMALSTVRQTASGPLQCCARDGSSPLPPPNLPDACFPIPVPEYDPVYKRYNLRCMEFVRSMTVPPDDCVPQAAFPLSVVTAHLDLSQVYDNNDTANSRLRGGMRGRLLVKKYPSGEFLPLTPESPAPCADRDPSCDVCFMGGDVRVNQNPLMTSTHVLYLREHNRIAEILAAINPHWDDDRIYQETRRILIACYQHIIYEEMLPVFIGHEAIQKYFKSYVYDENLCPGTFVEFTTVCFRYFHTLIQGILKIMTQERTIIKNLVLTDSFNRPTIVIEKFEELLIGSITQPSRKKDDNFDREIADELFRPNRTTFGMSLPSLDIQRARDHGVPPYNDLREMCGLPRAYDFDDLADTTSRASIAKLRKAYKHVDDIDPLVGGSLEYDIPGTLMGPTFLCLMVNQFLLSQKSDRFFYLNRKQEYPFTEKQIKEIKKASIARLMCDHTGVSIIQKQPFLQISEGNPLVNCKHIPTINLSAWMAK